MTLDSTHTLAETVPAALQGLAAVTLAPVNAQGHTPHSLGHRKHLPVASRPRNALALAYVTFIVVYLGTSALMTRNRSFAFWPGHSRYLAPVYVPVVLALVLALDRIRPWGRRNRGGALPRLLKSLRAAWAVAGILARVRADLAASPATRYTQAHLTPGHLQPSAATRLYPGGAAQTEHGYLPDAGLDDLARWMARQSRILGKAYVIFFHDEPARYARHYLTVCPYRPPTCATAYARRSGSDNAIPRARAPYGKRSSLCARNAAASERRPVPHLTDGTLPLCIQGSGWPPARQSDRLPRMAGRKQRAQHRRDTIWNGNAGRDL